ncbi:transketolase family protein [Candidatus Kaiserbacteria bacterium]|nr:transketolase family protein [Candidatus Kaiserbacteria bacterium]
MLNEKLKLHPKIFDDAPEAQPLRAGFGEGLVEAARADKNVVGLCADLTVSTRMDAFKKEFPDRFVEMGVAEQNLAVTASGMAAMGKVPFITSYAMFSPGRNWEQIRTTICYNDRPVKIVGSHAGISVGPDGGTHQAIEDMAIMRVIPRMVVIAPCDSNEAKKATIAMAKSDFAKFPTYLRLAREKTPLMTTLETPFEIGKAYELWRGDNPQVAFIGCGPVLHNTLKAAKKLSEEGIGSVVLNVHTVKPLDEEAIVALAKEVGAVVTVEEHQIAGGFGSAVSEALAAHHPVPCEFIGMHDAFGQSGKPEELIEHYGMGTSHIIDAARRVIGRK